jgi:hypothetical protein
MIVVIQITPHIGIEITLACQKLISPVLMVKTPNGGKPFVKNTSTLKR